MWVGVKLHKQKNCTRKHLQQTFNAQIIAFHSQAGFVVKHKTDPRKMLGSNCLTLEFQ